MFTGLSTLVVIDTKRRGSAKVLLPQVKLMPTGGVTPDNAGDWIRAGAVAVAAGSSLLDAKAIEGGNFDVITANARKFVENVRAARTK